MARNGQRQCGGLSVYRPPLSGKIASASPVKTAFLVYHEVTSRHLIRLLKQIMWAPRG